MKSRTAEERIISIDILRGAVMILMAIDHMRVYSGIPAGGTTPGIFFTRWITNFCAPAFVFFAGTSAFLYGRKLGSQTALAKFLVSRGLLLVVLELTLIRFAWTFNLDYNSFILVGVIWMLGWCMVLLALFIRLKPLTIAIIGICIIVFQQLFHYLPEAFPLPMRKPVGTVWAFFYYDGFEPPPGIAVLYVLLPWLGVMMAGYGFGVILLKQPEIRKKLCLWIGLSSIALFLIIGMFLLPAESNDKPMPALFRFLNQRKYPPSQLFLLMTLGPVIALVPYAEKARGWLAKICLPFGRVPMFYYLLHIPLIHAFALFVNYLKEGAVHQEWYTSAPFTEVPEPLRWNLPMLYFVFILAEVVLYLLCRSYANYKLKNQEKSWLKYL